MIRFAWVECGYFLQINYGYANGRKRFRYTARRETIATICGRTRWYNRHEDASEATGRLVARLTVPKRRDSA